MNGETAMGMDAPQHAGYNDPFGSPGGPSPRRRRSLGSVVAGAVLVVIVAVAAVALTTGWRPGSGSATAARPMPEPSTITVTGSITVAGTKGDAASDNGCTPNDGYDDITSEGQVTVTDPSSRVVGVGELGEATWIGTDDVYGSCTFTITVDDVPRGLKFYGIAIGHRSPVQEPEADLTAPLALTLGV